MIEIILVTGASHIFYQSKPGAQYENPLDLWIDKIATVQGYVDDPDSDNPKSMISLDREDWITRMANRHQEDCEATAKQYAIKTGAVFNEKKEPKKTKKEKKDKPDK